MYVSTYLSVCLHRFCGRMGLKPRRKEQMRGKERREAGPDRIEEEQQGPRKVEATTLLCLSVCKIQANWLYIRTRIVPSISHLAPGTD